MKLSRPLHQVVYHYRKGNKDIYTTKEFPCLMDALRFVSRNCHKWTLPFQVGLCDVISDEDA